MRNYPSALELLKLAEQKLTTEVMKNLSNGQRYNLALVASAIAIAKRELSGTETAWLEELEVLRTLYKTVPPETNQKMLKTLNILFARDIRAGLYDEQDSKQKLVLKLLCKDVLARLEEDNPNYARAISND
tara:strand:+ start:1116 stop:1508 length:393 start_codon:yes stop_codon:yes gene_type:complete